MSISKQQAEYYGKMFERFSNLSNEEKFDGVIRAKSALETILQQDPQIKYSQWKLLEEAIYELRLLVK